MKFTPNQAFSTPLARVVVDAGLPPGLHQFQLVVVGASGRRSSPVEVAVTVLPRVQTIPIPGPLRPAGPIPVPSPRFPP